MPGMPMATSLNPMNPKLKNNATFKAATPPVPSLMEFKPKDPISTIPNNLSAPYNLLHLESTTKDSAVTSQSSTISKNEISASFIITMSSSLSFPVDGSAQTKPIVNYEMPASPEALSTACAHASITAPNTPLGTIWSCATKSGFDEGSSRVDGMLVTDILKTGFEKENIWLNVNAMVKPVLAEYNIPGY
jgi:hypothetical protein